MQKEVTNRKPTFIGSLKLAIRAGVGNVRPEMAHRPNLAPPEESKNVYSGGPIDIQSPKVLRAPPDPPLFVDP